MTARPVTCQLASANLMTPDRCRGRTAPPPTCRITNTFPGTRDGTSSDPNAAARDWRSTHMTARAQQTRQLIIERSAAAFDQMGFAGATLIHLAAATGLTKGTSCSHCDTKSTLAVRIRQRA